MSKICKCTVCVKASVEKPGHAANCLNTAGLSAGLSREDGRDTLQDIARKRLKTEEDTNLNMQEHACYRCIKVQIGSDSTQAQTAGHLATPCPGDSTQTSDTSTTSSDTLVSCDLCPFVVNSASALENHYTVHNTEKGKPFLCKECDYKNLSKTRDFNDHVLVHTNYKPHACRNCDKCYKTYSDLIKHIKQKHPISALICEHCTFSTPYPRALDKHCKWKHTVNSSHTNYRPYHCSFCPSCFKVGNNLCKHIKDIHGTEFFINCKFCDYSAPTPSHMDKHTKDVHQTNKLNLIYCQTCDFVATSTRSIDIHQTVHQPRDGTHYCCEECNFKTPMQDKFNRHIFVHTRDTPFICTHCKSSFTRPDGLTRHLRNFHPGLTLDCDYCTYSTHSVREMEKHHKHAHVISPDPSNT